MKLVINQIPIQIKKKNNRAIPSEEAISLKEFCNALSYSPKTTVFCTSGTDLLEVIERCVEFGHLDLMRVLTEISIQSADIKGLKEYVKSELKFIYAAGGLVVKAQKLLMIYRLDKWDLPKGKLEKGEANDEAALREVEEECGVKVSLKEYLGSTFHTYPHKGKLAIKETYWYGMDCLEDRKMKPQKEEGIEAVVWKNKKQVEEAMNNTFPNIQLMVERFYLQ